MHRTPDTDDETAVVIRLRPRTGEPALPAGWVAEDIRWDGRDREIAYDRRHLQVMRTTRDTIDRELRATFRSHGWRRLGADTEGVELWVRDREHSRIARLDRLAQHASVEADRPDAPSVA